MKNKIILLFVILITLSGTAQKWTLYNPFSTAKQLGSNMVYAIAVDSSDNKWFGTQYGVSKFDGSNWTIYRTTDGLANNNITCLAIDSQGNKWFGTWGGVSKFDGIHWKTYTVDDGLVSNNIRCITIDAKGNIWFGTSSGISKFDGINWTTYSNGLVNDNIYSCSIDKEGNLWFGTENGLLKFNGLSWEILNAPYVNNIQSIIIDSLGNKWLGTGGTDGGACKYDGTKWERFDKWSTNYGLPCLSVHSIAIDAYGNKWFATDNGISKFDDTNWTTCDTVAGLRGNNVMTIFIDVHGYIWAGTIDGVYKYDGTQWTTYKTGGLQDDRIGSVAIDSKDKKWFVVGNDVSEFDGTNCIPVFNQDYGYPKTIAIDAQDNKWVGTYPGIKMFDGTKWTTYSVSDGLADITVNCIAFDSKGNKWIGTEDGGISIFDGTNWTTISISDGLINNHIESLAIDADDVKWIGYGTWSKGITKLDGRMLTNYTYDINCGVTTIGIDSHNNKWFGLYGAGIVKFDGTTWTANSLNDNNIKALAVDTHDNIWVGSCEGWLSKFDGSKWNSYNIEKSGIGRYCINAIAIDHQGNKWITTWAGIVKLEDLVTEIDNQVPVFKIENNLTIYPNPSLNQTTLLFPENDKYILTVTDISGKTILQSTFTGEKTVLQTANINSGIYLLSLQSLTDGKIFKNKLIVTK